MTDEIQGYELSPHQAHLWKLWSAGQTPSLIQFGVQIDGDLDHERLRSALDGVLRRHDILRTRFVQTEALDVPVQVVCETALVKIAILDNPLAEMFPAPDLGMSVQDATTLELTVGLARIGHARHLLVLQCSPMLMDAYSAGILARDLACAYESSERFLELEAPLPHIVAAEWENEMRRSAESEPGRTFWRRRTSSLPQRSKLPYWRLEFQDKPAFPKTQPVELPEEAARNLPLQPTTREEPVLLACWTLLLAKLNSETQIRVGISCDGRSASELRTALGPYGRFIPAGFTLGPDSPFTALLEDVEHQLAELREWQEYFDWSAHGEDGSSGCNEFCFEYVSLGFEQPAKGATFCATSVRSVEEKFTVKLSCLRAKNSLSAEIAYDPGLVSAGEARLLASRFTALLTAALRQPETRLVDLDPLSAEEWREICQGEVTHPKPTQFLEMFEDRARTWKDAIAVSGETAALSYGELIRRSARLAESLIDLGVCPESPVLLALPACADAIVAILATMRAGGSYVPVDPGWPRQRREFILRDAAARVVITSADGDAEFGPAISVLRMPAASVLGESRRRPPFTGPASPERAAYILYTSGSTGAPKGVVVTHSALSNYLDWCMNSYGVEAGRGAPLHSALTFDLTVTSLFAPLLAGRTVFVTGQGVDSLASALRDAGDFSLLKITPAHLEALSHLLPPGAARSARTLVIGGEALQSEALNFWREHSPDTAIVNEYGPTEATVGCCAFQTTAGECVEGEVPIGSPIAGFQLYVADPLIRPVCFGVPGELLIAGAGLARGYLNRPDLTAERFRPDPFSSQPGSRLYLSGDIVRRIESGDLLYLGRRDSQVKIRGYRIELGEIQAAIRQHPGVQESAVVVIEKEGTNRQIAAYAVPHPHTARTLGALLRTRLTAPGGTPGRHQLPNGMIVFHLNSHETDYLYREIFEAQEYLRHGVQIEDGDCILDIGANIGIFTLLAGTSRRNVRIVACEPIEPICRCLRLNAQLYELNAEVLHCGVGDRSEVAEFTYYPQFSVMSTRFADKDSDIAVVRTFERNRRAGADTEILAGPEFQSELERRLEPTAVECRIRTISEIVEECGLNRIDLLKIDAERSEWEVLAGIEDRHWPIIRQLVIEVHDLEGRMSQVQRLLSERGFEVTVEQSTGLRGTELHNVFAVRERPKDRPAKPRAPSGWYSFQEWSDSIVSFVRERLPEHMVPARITAVERIPLNGNGKVDRDALTAIADPVDAALRPFAEPRTAAERTLARIWCELLKLNRVSIHDNFFELGGDSIQSIQAAAMAGQSGIQFTARQLFSHPTIAELAALCGSLEEREAPRPFGRVPLTPVQHWFFELGLDRPERFVQSARLECRGGLEIGALRRALQYIAERHDGLFLRYTQENGEWVQHYERTGETSEIPLLVADIRRCEPVRSGVRRMLLETLDIQKGPIFRVAVIQGDQPNPDEIVIVIHHLVCDNVSWHILLDELEAVYAENRRAGTPQLAAPGASFRMWSEALQQSAHTSATDHLGYWLNACGAASRLGLNIGSPEIKKNATYRIAEFELTEEETRRLQNGVNAGTRGLFHAVIASVATALSKQNNSKEHWLDLEHHGRDGLSETQDFSRTVGWFTVQYPAMICLRGNCAREIVAVVGEQLSAVPENGYSYGMLRYLNAETSLQLRNSPRPSACVNFLGTAGATSGSTRHFRLARGADERAETPSGHSLSVVAWMGQNRLRLSCKGLTQGGCPDLDQLGANAVAFLRALGEDASGGAQASGVEASYPLTAMQEGMLFDCLHSSGAPLYNAQFHCSITSPVDLGTLREVWQEVAGRHTALRTSFVWSGEEQPMQRVVRSCTLPWVVLDWRNAGDANRPSSIEAYLNQERTGPFDLSKAPLMRFAMIRQTEDKWHFVWTFHHLILDGWSVSVVIREVFERYHARLRGQTAQVPPAKPYEDYVQWLSTSDPEEAERYWRGRLSGFLGCPRLGDRREGRGAARGEQVKSTQLSRKQTSALNAMSRSNRLTLNTVLQGLWGIALASAIGVKDLVFGVTVAGRPSQLPGAGSMVGLFINTVPVRILLNDADGLAAWLAAGQETESETRCYEHTPLVRIQSWSELPMGVPLFESLYVFENYPMFRPKRDQGGVSISDASSHISNSFPLTARILPKDRLSLQLLYDPNCLTPDEAERLLAHFERAITCYLHNPDGTIGGLKAELARMGRNQKIRSDQKSTEKSRGALRASRRRSVSA